MPNSFHNLTFTDLFQLEDIQKIQDAFALATGVASIIATPDGTPLTRPSNFCKTCELIRGTEKGRQNCMRSDATVCRRTDAGTIITPCQSGGFWDAGAHITVGNRHIASWLAGQVRSDDLETATLLQYADELGLDRNEYAAAVDAMPRMSKEQFQRVAEAMFVIAQQLSRQAFQIFQLRQTILEKAEAEERACMFDERFQTIFDAVGDGIHIHDWPSGRIIDVNQRNLEIFGYTRDEFLNLTVSDLVAGTAPYDLAHATTVLHKVDTEGPQLLEWLNKRKNGEQFWSEISLRAAHIGEQQIMVVVVRDITERKEAEAARRREQDFTDAVIDSIPGLLYLYDEDGYLVRWNRQHSLSTGYTDEELSGMHISDWYRDDPDSLNKITVAIANVHTYGTACEEALLTTKSGNRIPFLFTAVSLEFDGRSYFTGIGIDMSERVAAERALARERLFTDAIMESVPGLVYIYDSRGLLVRWNKNHERLTGYTSQELQNRYVLSWFDQDVQDAARASFQNIIDRGMTGESELELRIKDGSSIPCLFTGVRHIIDGEAYMVGMGMDISARKQAEERLRHSESKFVLLFQHSPDAYFLALETGTVIDVNEAFVRMTGYSREQIIGHSTRDLNFYVDPVLRSHIYSQLRRGDRIHSHEVQIRTRRNDILTCSITGHVIRIEDQAVIMIGLRDVTEFKKMQEMMIQTEKMMSVGGIAAGIAHEINNPLSIIIQAAQLFVQRTTPDHPKNIAAARRAGIDLDQLQTYIKARKLDVYVHDIREAALRAATIIRNMLEFSRHSESRRKVCELHDLIDRAVSLAGSDYNLRKGFDFKRIRIVRDYADELPSINCTETEIEQVILNLVRNAAHALVETDKPTITIRTRSQDCGIVIEVEDNGPGIPPAVAKRVFEPFFTTKPPGQGTGLGLSVSYFIITNGHGGTMSVDSLPGHGACFRIELPLNLPCACASADDGDDTGKDRADT